MIEKTHHFIQIVETIWTLSEGNWISISLRLSNVFTEYFPKTDQKVFEHIISRFFRRMKSTSDANTGMASGMFGDVANALDSLEWITSVTNWHGILRHLVAHLLVLPHLGLESLLDSEDFLHLIDRSAVESLSKGSPLKKIEDFVVVLKGFCAQLDNFLDPSPDAAGFMQDLSSVQGWAMEIQFLESNLGSRSEKPRAGCITYAEFNLRVLRCEAKKANFSVSGPYNLIIGEALRRLSNIKSAQLHTRHPDPSAPFVIAISGISGAGKTTVATFIARYLLRLEPQYSHLTDADIDEMTYFTTPTSKWVTEGYNPEKHKVAMFDEIGTILNENSPIHPFLLKIMEHGNHQTDQASAHLKGKVPFTSKIIILLTNDKMFGLNQDAKITKVHNPAAWFRRFDIHIDAVCLNRKFTAPGRRTCDLDVANTLNVAQWHLMKNEGCGEKIGPVPEVDKNGNPVYLDITSLMKTIEERRAQSIGAKQRADRLSHDSFNYYKCKDESKRTVVSGVVVNRFDCDCCIRCPTCNKTDACSQKAVCSTECLWHVSPGDADHKGVAASSFVRACWRDFVERYGYVRGSFYFSKFTLQFLFCKYSPLTQLGAGAYASAAVLGLYQMIITPVRYALFGTFIMTPFGTAVAMVIWVGMFLKPNSLANAVYDTIADGFESVMAQLPIQINMPLNQAYYASQVFKFASALFCGVAFSSIPNLVVMSWFYSATGTYLFPVMHVSFMSFYSFICLHGFYQNPRFFGRNSDVNSWYHARKLRSLGIDPAKVHAGLTMIITFVATYALVKKLQGKKETEPVVKAQVVTKVETSSMQDLFVNTPYVDVFSSKRSFWGNKTDHPDWPLSQIPLDRLIDKVVKAQVRFTIDDGGVKTYVGGTSLSHNVVATVYHAINILNKPGSTIATHARVNGVYQQVAPATSYAADGVRSLPSLSKHIDLTNDIIGVSVPGKAPSPKITQHVMRCYTGSSPFKAVVIHMNRDGEVGVVHGIASPSHQTITLDGSTEKLYTARFYDFVPESTSDFESYGGICGGCMIKYTPTKCAIVGILAATFFVDVDGNVIKRVAALPINSAGVDFSSLGTAIPSSFPDVLRPNSDLQLQVDTPFQSDKYHSTHAKTEGRLLSMYGTTEILGTVPNSVVYPKSRTTFYGWEDDIFTAFPEFEHDKIPPLMNAVKIDGEYFSPGRNAIQDLAQSAQNPILPYHYAAAEHVLKEFDPFLDIFQAYAPLDFLGDMSLSITGVDGSELHTGIKRTTGAGFPYVGKKSNYLIYNKDNTVRLKPEIMKQVSSNFEMYAEEVRLGCITRATYKDEPRSKDKVRVRKIRAFAPAEFDKFLNVHILINSLVQLGIMSRKATLTMGGMSVFTEEWSQLRSDREKDKPNCIVGDFSKFDKRTSLLTLLTTSNIDLELIRTSLFFKNLSQSDADMFVKMYHTTRCDASNSLLIIDGELLNPAQSTSSGGADTFKQNGTSHKLDVREASLIIVKFVSDGAEWLEHSVDRVEALALAKKLRLLPLSERLKPIFDNIDDITLGDDGCYAVSDEYIPLFHFHTFKLAYAEMGLTFTLPDKTLGTGSHVSWDEVDIGQRRFVRDAELDTYLAPLSGLSIGKMLTIGVVNDMTVREKRESAVYDAIMEFAQYGREKYDEWISRLKPICTKWEIDITFPEWLSVVTSNRNNRSYIARGENQAAVSAIQIALDTLYEEPKTAQAQEAQARQEMNSYSDTIPPMTSRQLLPNTPSSHNNNSNVTSAVASSETSDINHQDKISSVESSSSENVTFLEAPQSYTLDLTNSPDATFSESGAKDCGIDGFLNRYIELETMQWTVGSDLLQVIDPWTLWRSNPRIAQKLAHYRYLKCNLEVKFVINGTAFHYGQIMAAYAPMLSYWGRDFDVAATATAHRGDSSLYNFRHYGTLSGVTLKETTDSYFSTMPHIMLMPGDNNPVELKLPFIWHNNYLRVNKTDDTYSNGTGMETPGSVVITDVVGLGKATDTASNALTISVWCRATDIDLNTPTTSVAANGGVSLSGPIAGVAASETQQASTGFVSTLATGMAKYAHAAAVIPGVRPYAKATEVAATSVSAIAQLFGFSKPTDVSSCQPMAVTNARGIALTNTADTSQKLAFDANQEITVDSRVIGSDGKDEMCFASINQRWWWCGKAPWTPSSSTGNLTSYGFLASSPNLLYRCLVSPTMWRRFQTNHSASRHAWQLNPAGYLANTFNFWRGSVTYRIQVIASKFHTGRIKIQFDPHSGDENASEVETRYTWILDLSEASEIDVTIPYTAFRSYLDRQNLAEYGLQDPEYSNTSVATTKINFNENTHMGFLSISIVNHLVSPNGIAGKVNLSIWQRCENDTEYQVPATEWHNNIIRATGASETEEEAKGDELLNTSAQIVDMWPTSPCPDRTAVWFGERVLSVRALLKRYSYSNTLTSTSTSNGVILHAYTVPHWPSVSQTNWGLKNTYVSYFSPCYLAKRGGMRYKMYFWQVGATNNTPDVRGSITSTNVERLWSPTYVGYTGTSSNMNNVSASPYDNAVAGGSSGGLLLGAGLGDSLAEVESPYYQNVRFQLAQFFGTSNSPIDVGNNYVRFTKTANGATNVSGRLSIYQAAAEDTSFMFFLAAPVLYES
jgi:hypothetical protein